MILEGSGFGQEELSLDEGPWVVQAKLRYNEVCIEGECRVAPFSLGFTGRDGTTVLMFQERTVIDTFSDVYCMWATSLLEVASGKLAPGFQELTVDAAGDWRIEISPATDSQKDRAVGEESGFYERENHTGTERVNVLCDWSSYIPPK